MIFSFLLYNAGFFIGTLVREFYLEILNSAFDLKFRIEDLKFWIEYLI